MNLALTHNHGATIACAMEMYGNGIISKEELGRDLFFGDDEGIVN